MILGLLLFVGLLVFGFVVSEDSPDEPSKTTWDELKEILD